MLKYPKTSEYTQKAPQEWQPAPKRRLRALKWIAGIIGGLVLLCALTVGGYALYLTCTYERIPDNQILEIKEPAQGTLSQMELGREYSAMSYNIGFGAYTPDYTFFMDEGAMKDGTETRGVRGRAVSLESVENCTQGAIDSVKKLNPNFVLLQEIDTQADRSFNVNQVADFQAAFPHMGSMYAVNFHSSFLPVPIYEPHGVVNGGLLTLTTEEPSSALRRSYYIDESFPSKFFDLDRCFQIMRFPVKDGHELVLINSHMSAYDKAGLSRQRQLALLCEVLDREAKAGNYVIAGGDWNHALCGSLEIYPSEQKIPSWVATLDDKDLPEGFRVVCPENLQDVASCRGDDIPYEKGVTYETTVDGFIVSSNVEAHAQTIDTGFAFSDHNPAYLRFSLKK